MKKVAREGVRFILIAVLILFIVSVIGMAKDSGGTQIAACIALALYMGVIGGVPSGFGIWLAYRVVRFAI